MSVAANQTLAAPALSQQSKAQLDQLLESGVADLSSHESLATV